MRKRPSMTARRGSSVSCMSGGVGSRLWPLSREDNPKQFHDLSGDGSMLVKTLQRLAARPAGETPIYPDRLRAPCRPRAHRPRRDRPRRRRRDLRAGRPQHRRGGRRRHAADARPPMATMRWCWSCRPTTRSRPSASSGTPSRPACAAADGGSWSCSASSRPSRRPATATSRSTAGEARFATSSRFVEKPDLETAKSYLAAGNFFWNTGIFLFRASAMRDAFAEFQPGHLEARPKRHEQPRRATFPASICRSTSTARSPSISIDYAIMERASRHRHGAGDASAGTISAPGSRCSTSARPTRTATSSSATSSPSTARIPTCAARGGCCRRSA